MINFKEFFNNHKNYVINIFICNSFWLTGNKIYKKIFYDFLKIKT